MIALVACVKGKLEEPSPARDLYTSSWFRKARAYVESRPDTTRWYVLSAEHGLQTLVGLPVAQRRAWAARVLNQIREEIPACEDLVILAGRNYREFLMDELYERHPSVSVPMRGLGIGDQLSWLKRTNPPTAT